jgi:hypothetical protein
LPYYEGENEKWEKAEYVVNSELYNTKEGITSSYLLATSLAPHPMASRRAKVTPMAKIQS